MGNGKRKPITNNSIICVSSVEYVLPHLVAMSALLESSGNVIRPSAELVFCSHCQQQSARRIIGIIFAGEGNPEQ